MWNFEESSYIVSKEETEKEKEKEKKKDE